MSAATDASNNVRSTELAREVTTRRLEQIRADSPGAIVYLGDLLEFSAASRAHPAPAGVRAAIADEIARGELRFVGSVHDFDLPAVQALGGELLEGAIVTRPISNGNVEVRGSYPAGDGPDWGWRIVLSPARARLEITMFNVTPDGAEERAVEGIYAR